MKPPADRKLYLGPKLRLLRRELGINQSQMAGELGVSPSYLNHLERNQRPLTAQMLLRLADTYDIDIRDFVAGSTAEVATGLREVFSDALLRDIGVPRDEVNELAENYPGVVEAVTRLYRALTDLRRLPGALDRISESAKTGTALDWVREHIDQQRNHFPEIETAAEALAAELPEEPAHLHVAIEARLERAHGISVRTVGDKMMNGALRFYDFHRRRLMLSDRMPAASRLFAIAYQLVMIELERPIEAQVARAAPDAETRPLFKTMLANYAAAAVIMPYRRFQSAAEETRYHIPLLETRFGASFEQVAHRLTTLGRSGERGVPFFMLKVDIAGTISKRFSGEGLPIARFGGACPRWRLYRAFQAPGQTMADLVEMPEGDRYFTLSRTIPGAGRDPAARSVSVIALGCDVKHAARILAADGLLAGPANPIGPACHLCERPDCPDRALPPVTRSLDFGQFRRSSRPYPFRQA